MQTHFKVETYGDRLNLMVMRLTQHSDEWVCRFTRVRLPYMSFQALLN